MKQISILRSVLYHLYPAIVIAICFSAIAPVIIRNHYPPQFGLLISIVIAAIPILAAHLLLAQKKEEYKNVQDLNGYKNKLPRRKLILYALGLVIFSFFVWGITQPINKIITDKLFSWLPAW